VSLTAGLDDLEIRKISCVCRNRTPIPRSLAPSPVTILTLLFRFINLMCFDTDKERDHNPGEELIHLFFLLHKLYLVSVMPSSPFGVLASNQNSIHEEIMSKLKSGNACCCLVRSLVFRFAIQRYKYQDTGEWRRLHHEELYGLYFSQNTVKPGYNDVGLYDTPSIASDTPQYQLIPHC